MRSHTNTHTYMYGFGTLLDQDRLLEKAVEGGVRLCEDVRRRGAVDILRPTREHLQWLGDRHVESN